MDEKLPSTPSMSSVSSTPRDEEEGAALAKTETGHATSHSQVGPAEGSVLSRVLSRVQSRDVDPGPPPDGGYVAWSQAVLCHLVIFNTWGFVNSFGLFQTYYTEHLGMNPSAISWIGTIQIFIPFLIGSFSGSAVDAGYFRLIFAIGVPIQVFGLFMTSLCTTYWQIFLAQGICVGLGNGLVFIPAMTLVATYFLKNRGVAIAVTATGSATGGVVYPAIAESLLPKVGFGWTVRVMGFLMLCTMVVAAAFLKPRLPPRKSGPLVELSAFKELPYLFFAIGSFFCFWGLYVVFYYIGSYAHDTLGTPYSTSINLLMIMSGVGGPGRIVPNYCSDRWTGSLNLMIVYSAVCSIVMFTWIAVDSVAGVWIFATFYGLACAGVQSLFPTTLASLTKDPKYLGTRIGMTFSLAGFGCLTGPPIGGALIRQDNGRYLYAQIFAALAMGVGCVALVAARFTLAGWKKVKV